MRKKLWGLVRVFFILAIAASLFPEPVSAARPADSGWVRLSDPAIEGGVVRQLVMAPSNADILYAALALPSNFTDFSAHWLYRSQDGGQTWHTDHNAQPMLTALAVDPQDAGLLYALQLSGQVARSNDSGETWQSIFSGAFDLTVPATNRIYLEGTLPAGQCSTPAYDFVRSLDGGQNWEHVFVSCEFTEQARLFANPHFPERVFLASEKLNRIWSSQDSGATWQSIQIDGQSSRVDAMAFDPANPDHLFLAGWSIWSTQDGGETWNACGALSENPSSPLVYAQGDLFVATHGSPSTLYRSDDQCASWWKSTSNLPAPVSSLLADVRAPDRMLAGTAGYGVFQSANKGATWQESNSGLVSVARVDKVMVSPANPQVILAGGNWPRPAVFASSDSGLSWTSQPFTQEPRSILLHAADSQKAWVATQDAVYSTADLTQWNLVLSGYGPVHAMVACPHDPDHPYVLLEYGKFGNVLQWGVDSGFPFWFGKVYLRTVDIYSMAVNPIDPLDWMIAGIDLSDSHYQDNVVLRSLDGGKTWQVVFRRSYYGVIRKIVIDPRNPQNRFIQFDSQVVFRSTTGGQSWQSWSEGIPLSKPSEFAASLVSDGHGGVYTFFWGVYHRSMNNPAWTMIFNNLDISSGDIWRGSAPFLVTVGSSGVWRLDLPPIHTFWLPRVGN